MNNNTAKNATVKTKKKTRAPRQRRKNVKGGLLEDGELAMPLSHPSSDVAGVRRLTIPRNEQDRILSFLQANDTNPVVLNYLETLICPKNVMTRVPDSFARPTALVRSIITYDIAPRIDATLNSGRFAVSVQPILGSSGSGLLKDWKVALVSNTVPWPVDFTNEGNFIKISGGTDLRVDPFFPTLTQNIPGFLTGAALTPASLTPFNGVASYVVDPSYSLNIGFDINAAGDWFLSPGTYYLSVLTQGAAPNTLSVTASVANNLQLMSGVNGSFNVALTYVYIVEAYNEFFSITQSVPSTNLWVSISTTLAAAGGSPADFGLVTQIRPVSMSVLASYIGTTLQDGGNIAAAYVPGGTLESNYFVLANNTSPLGCFEYWEALSKQPTSYNGPIRDGAYVWWAPEDYDDVQMVKPSATSEHDYPAIIVSGQSLPGPFAGDVYVAPTIRLEVVTCYEFVTNSLLFETSAFMGSQAMMDASAQALFGQPHAMPNAIHAKWLSDFLGGIKKGVGDTARFISKNAKTILPMIGTVGSML